MEKPDLDIDWRRVEKIRRDCGMQGFGVQRFSSQVDLEFLIRTIDLLRAAAKDEREGRAELEDGMSDKILTAQQVAEIREQVRKAQTNSPLGICEDTILPLCDSHELLRYDRDAWKKVCETVMAEAMKQDRIAELEKERDAEKSRADNNWDAAECYKENLRNMQAKRDAAIAERDAIQHKAHEAAGRWNDMLIRLASERDGLRKAIEAAPHEAECSYIDSLLRYDGAGRKLPTVPCDCWKSRALTAVPASTPALAIEPDSCVSDDTAKWLDAEGRPHDSRSLGGGLAEYTGKVKAL
jgi:hypothetical protein